VADFADSLAYFQKGMKLSERLYTIKPDNNFWFMDMRYALLGGIANSLNGLGRNEEAEVKYGECLKLNTVDEFAIYEVNLRRCQWAMGKLEEASDGLLDFLRRRAERYGVDDTDSYE
jgi:tetratricopeptide (TPR) repeat protein